MRLPVNLHPLSWLPQSLLVCLAGELVKQLVTTVKDENNRDNQLEEPQATAPSSTISATMLPFVTDVLGPA